MIKTIFIDFFGTLVHWEPSATKIQKLACAAEGFEVSEDALVQGYIAAGTLMATENAISPIHLRPLVEREGFFSEYERKLLEASGLQVSAEIASLIWEGVQTTPKKLVLYGDSLTALKTLKTLGLKLAIISNMGQELHQIIIQLGLAKLIDFGVTSSEAGSAKPHPAIFQLALKRADVSSSEVIHVGDDYEGDILGARGIGIHSVLINRDGKIDPPNDCPVISSLEDLVPYVNDYVATQGTQGST
jgi:HAD superfamily hydrolase (TIGR01549 family)